MTLRRRMMLKTYECSTAPKVPSLLYVEALASVLAERRQTFPENTIEAYGSFTKKKPESEYSNQALSCLFKLALKQIKAINSIFAYQKLLNNYCNYLRYKKIRRVVSVFMAVTILSISCGKKEEAALDEKWPQTLEEATERIITGMNDSDKKIVIETPEKDLIIYHIGWGTSIRNSFGLWQGNNALLESCGTKNPDVASMVIIRSVWEKLIKSGEFDHGTGRR